MHLVSSAAEFREDIGREKFRIAARNVRVYMIELAQTVHQFGKVFHELYLIQKEIILPGRSGFGDNVIVQNLGISVFAQFDVVELVLQDVRVINADVLQMIAKEIE